MVIINLLLTLLLVVCTHLGQQCCALPRSEDNCRGNDAAFVQIQSNVGNPTTISPKQKSFHIPTTPNRVTRTFRNSGSNNDDEKGQNKSKKPKKSGYKFGDFTKSFVSKVTKKEDYEFGDLSKYLDQQVKTKISDVTQKEDYEFGDLSRYIDSRVKDTVASFANKDEYEFGDLSKEIVRRVSSSDFKWKDMVTLLKVLLSFGVGFSPISSFLPVKFLIDLLHYSITADVGERFVGSVTMEIDKRMKKAFTGDPEYQAGDITKKAILKSIGKDEYKFGDVTKTVLQSLEDKKKKKTSDESVNASKFLGDLDMEASEDLESWDSKIRLAEEKAMKKAT